MTPEEKAARLAAWNAAHPRHMSARKKRQAKAEADKLAFIKGIMEGKDATDAWADVHPGHSRAVSQVRASQSLSDPKTIALLNEAQRARAQTVGIDTQWAVDEFIEVYYECRENGDTKNALRALETIVKHTGGFEKGGDNGGSKPPIQINVVYHQRPSELPSVTVVEALPDGNRNGS